MSEEINNETTKKGRGRPKLKDGWDTRLEVRIGSEESDAINHMLIESDRSKSEIIRRAIMLYYRMNKGRW